jgi:hypothetical protein
MRAFFLWVAMLGVVSAALLSCTGATMVGDWTRPDASGQAYRKVFVLGLSDDGALRRRFERRLVERLAERGVEAAPSHEFITEDGQISEQDLWKAVQASGVSAVLMTRLARVDRWTAGTPDYLSSSAVPPFGRQGLYAYLSEARAPFRLTSVPDDRIYTLETTLWNVRRNELMWSGSTQSLARKEVGEEIDALASLIVKALARRGLI